MIAVVVMFLIEFKPAIVTAILEEFTIAKQPIALAIMQLMTIAVG